MTQFDSRLTEADAGVRRLMRIFMLVFAGLAFGIGGWAFAAKIESAVVASGTVAVRSNAQAVQHPEGGVVGALLVKEGQQVAEGEIVIRLDAAQVTAERAILERQQVELIVERARLVADRDGRETITAPPRPAAGSEAADAYAKALLLQETLFFENRAVRESRLSQLQERLSQIETQIGGLQRLRGARVEEQEHIKAELAGQMQLEKKRLIRRSVLRATQRQAARINGEIGDIDSRIASARSQMSETVLKIDEIKRSTRTETLDRLRQVEAELGTIGEQMAAATDRLRRLEIRAPRAGLVHELAVHTVGGVVGAGERLMSVIPADDPLIVTARIARAEIDQVHEGQTATVKVSAFKDYRSPEVAGQVVTISADQVQDPQTGESFFEITVALPADADEAFGERKLTPGLPAEVFLIGEERRVIDYLAQPIMDQFALTFREE